MHNIIFYLSYLSFPFLAFLIFLIYKKINYFIKNKILLIITLLFLCITLVFIYSRFLERNFIFVKTTEIEVGFSGKIVVISDLHLGVYKNVNFLKRIVNRINKIEEVDALLIPGDLTYYPQEDLDTLFSPLKDIKVPVYAVLGNHDIGRSGPHIRKKLETALRSNGVIFLHNTSAVIGDGYIKILGLGDRWTDEDDVSMINNFLENDNLIVLTHNPDTALKYNKYKPDLTITGHTHGGQIRIPFIYKNRIPCVGDFNRGLYDFNNIKIFVTSGIGEVGLPMRLGVPPIVEILELK